MLNTLHTLLLVQLCSVSESVIISDCEMPDGVVEYEVQVRSLVAMGTETSSPVPILSNIMTSIVTLL